MDIARVRWRDQAVYDCLGSLDTASCAASSWLSLAARVLRKAVSYPAQAFLARRPLIKVSLWGFPMVMRADHQLKWIVTREPLWSLPLVHAVQALGKDRVTVVDVGANTGDTAVLLESHLPGICRTLCIEPDDEFFSLCRFNTRNIPGVTL